MGFSLTSPCHGKKKQNNKETAGGTKRHHQSILYNLLMWVFAKHGAPFFLLQSKIWESELLFNQMQLFCCISAFLLHDNRPHRMCSQLQTAHQRLCKMRWNGQSDLMTRIVFVSQFKLAWIKQQGGAVTAVATFSGIERSWTTKRLENRNAQLQKRCRAKRRKMNYLIKTK